MMKRLRWAVLGVAIAALLAALSGCIQPILPDPIVQVISAEGVLYLATANGIPLYYDANVQAGDKIMFSWATGKDQLGNLVGLSDDTRWTIQEVRVQCAEKTEEDTVFWPTNLGPNECVWFPGWTAPTEAISGLPLPMYPLEGYPWDACGDHGLPDMGSQVATIQVSAKADWIEVELTLPAEGDYDVLWPGEMVAVKVSGETATRRLYEPGEIIVTQGTQTWTYTVPGAEFWIDDSFDMNVGPTGVC